ncbi:MAG: hypothetical protein H0T73_14170 [Ardenticatenales bacterium]|nr:hypothetical protein [Ardenticatenales bacterium]
MRLLRLLTLMVLLFGCSAPFTNIPLRLDEIPLPPPLTLYEGAYEVPLDSMVLSTRLAYQASAQEAEWAYYQLPAYESWEEVTRFYQETLPAMGWQAEPVTGSSPLLWSRESRRLVITLLPLPSDQDDTYLVMLLLVSE